MLPNQVALASALGYLSIGCWLCAQLPQVFKNFQLQSCDGLALPFLITWLFGDLTNLIGCLLTEQLPFQTYLAIYFCFIDITLLWQFFHYAKARPADSVKSFTPSHSVHNSLVLPSHGSPRATTVSGLQSQPHTASHRYQSHRPRPRRLPTGAGVNSPDASYAAIYEAALDVARAAERASAHRSASRRRNVRARHNTNDTTSAQATEDLTDDDIMSNSMHSEQSGHSSTYFDEQDSRMTNSTPGLFNSRGRSRVPRYSQTDTPAEEYTDQAGPLAHSVLGLVAPDDERRRRDTSRSLSLARGASGRGGRRAAGVAFMSLGLFARLYSLGHLQSASPSPTSIGVVLSNPVSRSHFPHLHPPIHASHPTLTDALFTSSTRVMLEGRPQHPDHDPDHDEPEPDIPYSFERIVGRVSAWTCTTLYLSSRLPQIWKNFQRKSVEGLSILLFFFAFCGNVTYVASILLNPAGNADPSEAFRYLLESLPYLIGSGGTVVFDLTILVQGWIYGSDSPVEQSSYSPLKRTRRLRMPSHRKKQHRHVEDGVRSMSINERAPLLGQTRTGRSLTPSDRGTASRTLSPDLQFTPTTAKTDDGDDRLR